MERGVKIEVKLEHDHQVFFKQKASVENKNEMINLLDDLFDKGVNLKPFIRKKENPRFW